jgi:hypothetical protein
LQQARNDPRRLAELKPATRALHQLFRTRAREAVALLPRARNIQNCFDPTSWDTALNETENLSPERMRAAIHPDCRDPQAFIPFWRETYLLCQSVRRAQPQESSALAPIETYATWLGEMRDWARLLPRTGPPIDTRAQMDVYFAWHDLFELPLGMASPARRTLPIYCPTESREQRRQGHAAPESLSESLGTLAEWERNGRIRAQSRGPTFR